MLEFKFAASQPAITNWLSGALETLIQLDPQSRDAATSGPMIKQYQMETAAPSAKIDTVQASTARSVRSRK